MGNKRKIHMSLSTRVTVYVAVVIMTVLMLSTLLHINEIYKDYLLSLEWRSTSLVQNLRQYAADLSGYPPEMQRTLGLSIVCETLMENNRTDGFIYVGIVDKKGIYIAHSEADKIGSAIPVTDIDEALSTLKVTTTMGPADLKTMIPVDGRTYNSVTGVIVVGFSRDIFNQKIRDTILNSLILFVIFQFLAYLIIRTIIHRIITEPIKQITKAAVGFSRGSKSSHFSVREDEVGTLAENFIMMQEKIQGHITLLNDEINQRKKAEEAINILEAKQRAMISNISDVISIIDSNSKIIYVSPNVTGLFIWNASDMIDHSQIDFIHPHDQTRVRAFFDDLLSIHPIINTIECRFKRGDREYVPIQMTGVNRLNNPQIGGLLLNYHDISERKKAEDNLLQAQKMESIGILARGVAHDFNNMLGGVVMAADLLESHVAHDPEGLEFLEMINSSARHAANLAGELLAFSKQKAVDRNVVDLHGVISDTENLLRKTIDKRIDIHTELKAERHNIMGDKGQLLSIFINMGINASHAIEGKGTITFESSNITFSKEYCYLSPFRIQPGDYIQIKVIDDGSGIPPEIQHQIFDPFFTTKELGKGTGLGLSASLGTIQQHNGIIEVTSEWGKGSVFIVSLPILE